MEKKMLAVTFTDGRTSSVIALDPKRDTPDTVKLLVSRMKENGWYPVAGSGRSIVIEDGVVRDYVAEPKLRSIWKVA